ncbi:MAG: hypothetical protein JO355_07140 [Planctomycetaceae bacterium]|nr:hypothetical protein [Planctomycetaceae bacterium]
MARKKSAAWADQPRPSRALRALREAFGLDDEDWQAFLRHARQGFADYEQVHWMAPKSTLRLRDVPAEWFEDPEALGYVAVRVLTEGETGLLTPVARHLLRVCDPEPGSFHGPPGIGLAWLHLARQGLDPPIAPDSLIHLALHIPKDFFHAVTEADLLPLGRLILEGRGAIAAWDLHALLAAVDRARISVRAPFRLFHDLMAEDWIAREVKREFCRGLLACPPEARRLKQRAEALHASIHADPERVLQYPMVWLELIRLDLRRRLPGLQRHAVRALVEDIGEPLRDVLAEFFLRPDRDPQGADAVTQGALDLVRHHAEELGPDDVRSLLRKAIKRGSAIVRQAAYRVGAERFGSVFARPALRDNARVVRDWANKLLMRDTVKPGRKANLRRRSSPSRDE